MNEDDLDIRKHEKKLDLLLEQRNLVAAAEADTQKSHDQAILTLSSAAIGLSLTFIHRGELVFLPVGLILSWTFFVVAIVCTLLSFRATVRALQNQAANLDAALADIRGNPEPKENPAAELSAFLISVANWTFVLGILALLAFVLNNLL